MQFVLAPSPSQEGVVKLTQMDSGMVTLRVNDTLVGMFYGNTFELFTKGMEDLGLLAISKSVTGTRRLL